MLNVQLTVSHRIFCRSLHRSKRVNIISRSIWRAGNLLFFGMCNLKGNFGAYWAFRHMFYILHFISDEDSRFRMQDRAISCLKLLGVFQATTRATTGYLSARGSGARASMPIFNFCKQNAIPAQDCANQIFHSSEYKTAIREHGLAPAKFLNIEFGEWLAGRGLLM